MKTTSRKMIVLFTWIMSGALIISACGSVGLGKAEPTATVQAVQAAPVEQGVIAEGHIEPKEHRYLSFAAPGTVAEVLVKAGDMVTEGQVLARLQNVEEAQARLDASNLEIASAQQALDDLQRTASLAHNQAWTALVQANQALTEAQQAWDELDTQATQDDIETAKTEVADAQKTLNDAQDDFDPYADLPEENEQRKSAQQTLDDAEKTYSEAVTKRDTLVNSLELAEATLEQAKTAQAEAQFHFDQTQDGVDPVKLNLAEVRLQAAQSQQAAAQAALDDLDLKAPFAGAVMDVNVIPNELVSQNDWAVLVADDSQWYVRTSDLTELEVVKVSLGQLVDILPDALSDLALTGTVEEISNTYTTKSGDILYEVRIKLGEMDPRLKWGMTVEATFEEQ